MVVPFVDLAAQYRSIATALDEAIRNEIHTFQFIRGKKVRAFEENFESTLNARHCITTGNGTDALFAVFKCLGVTAGDEVIVPAFTWISDAETVSLCGATPVFADIHPQTYTLNPAEIEKKITAKTKAVLVVHLYGQAAHMHEIQSICESKNLLLLEDCAQAHLTETNNRYAGTFGVAGTFSFYPTKNLGAFGDAGCVVTNNDTLAEKVRRFNNHGALEKEDHETEGTNSRLDSLQAAVLLAKLPHLKQWNAQRSEHAKRYSDQLRDESNIVIPFVRPDSKHTFHLYAVRAKHRDKLQEYLSDKGVQTIVHYPRALHNLPAYRHLHLKPADLPVANMIQDEILSLPIYPELSMEQIAYVCQNIKDFYRK